MQELVIHKDRKYQIPWDKVAERKKKEDAVLTITPEFGPFPYMVPLPLTQEPITDQWYI